MSDIKEIRKAAQAVYLATEESIAKDLSEKLIWCADRIEELEKSEDSKVLNRNKLGVGMYGETPKVQIGELSICRQDEQDETKGVWIEDKGGIGGSFSTSKIEAVLQEFYDKNL